MRAAGLVLLLAAAAPVAAGDPPPDSISAAKRDLAAIKSPVAQPDSAGNLPGLDLHDVGGAPPADHLDAPPLLSPDAELGPDGLKKRKEGTGNWLVDAMDKDRKDDRAGKGRGGDKDDLLKSDLDLLKADDRAGTHPEKEFQALDQTREKADAEEPRAPAYNPLDSFMSSWISAQDHDLLVPAAKPGGLAGDPGKGRPDSLQSLELGPGNAPDNLLPPLDTSALGDGKPGANPYVADLEAAAPVAAHAFPAPEALGFAPADLTDIPAGITSSGIDARPLDTPRSALPDFAQPSDDDKYFRQMKKF
jgi:hypothetical protein